MLYFLKSSPFFLYKPTYFSVSLFQMVTNEQVGPGGTTDQGDSGTTLSKLRQTLSSSLNAAQDKGK
jgi:hypothetical protein